MAWRFEVPDTAVCIGIAGISLLAVRRMVLYFTTRCPSRAMLTGKTVIVTGANCGIGYETALDLATRNAHVILACRDLNKGHSAAQKIAKITGNQSVSAKSLDLASFKSVREFSKEIHASVSKLDVLINNAGVMNCPYAVTENGVEMHMAVNHFGNFLLTNLLRDLLEKPDSSRVIFVSSAFHKYGSVNLQDFNSLERYKSGKPYGDSKLINLLFARELHNRVKDAGKISVYSLSPGMVVTKLGRHSLVFNKYFKIFCFPLYAVLYTLYSLLIKTAREGCQTVVYCAVAPELDGESDSYYKDFKKQAWHEKANDFELAKKVFDTSTKITGL